jgi:sulfatase maturation enzyme AslB (radical SAM superfamily)
VKCLSRLPPLEEFRCLSPSAGVKSGALQAQDKISEQRNAPQNSSFGIALVFHLSTRCNLECVYCNVDAGPHGDRPVLDPCVLEKWLEAFATLGPSEIAIQLHGGEPLIVDPPVELFAAIARNTLSRFRATKLTDIAIQSNGLGLDENRLESLSSAGLRINLSIDGPASIHDRQRVTAGKHSSHRQAFQAHHLLRARGENTAVISVVTDPGDVVPTVRFFLDEGFREARINPIRPEGRAAVMRSWDDESFMREMAAQYLVAARLIAAHNERFPHASFFEENLASLVKFLIGHNTAPPLFSWTFLIDDRGQLWAHPGAFGIDALRLTRNETPSTDRLRRALGLAGSSSLSKSDVLTGLQRIRTQLFSACAGCRTPDFCVPFYGPNGNVPTRSPNCVFRLELMGHLERWLSQDRTAACRIADLPGDSRGHC